MVFATITVYALLTWFLWGFFMALGWALGTWIMNRLLGSVWTQR